MVYNNKFVSVIKVGGRVLREQNGVVSIPFGSEYSILLKNLNSVKAQANISIDGKNATGWLVLNPNSNNEIERFIRNGNLKNGNRFKFIERTQEIENHRGVGSDDGLIRIEYKFERKRVEVPVYHYYDYPVWACNTRGLHTNSMGGVWGATASGGTAFQTNTSCDVNNASSLFDISKCASQDGWNTQSLNDQGITVAGSESNQQFYNVPDFETEASDVLIIKLRGTPAGSQPVVVQTRLECKTCGRASKSSSKFCANCGTSLVIY